MTQTAFVIGLGVSGRSAVQFLLDRGMVVYGYDDRPVHCEELIEGGMVVSDGNQPFSADELVVLSPGVAPNHPLVRAAYQAGCEVIGEAELAFRYLRGRAVGITGTNGKTTVTLMIAHVLNKAGIPAIAVGNVGLPLTSQIEQLNSGRVAVIELSSFQLETLSTAILDAAAFLNLSDNHLDHHTSYEQYGQSKCRIQGCLKEGAPLYIEEKAKQQCKEWLKGASVRSFGLTSKSDLYCCNDEIVVDNQVEYILPVAYTKCNLLNNLLAAYALCREMGVTPDLFFSALASFTPPPHRQEWIGEWRGVSWVNDSKATTPAATLAAISSVERPIFLIAGGDPKGVSFRVWGERFLGRVSKVFLFGQAAEQIEREIEQAVPTVRVDDLRGAVEQAAAEARWGDLVLLSPGCASYDMFSSYVERGERFKEYVHLVNRKGQE
jgi:UDP-N-acetylmuramoylalanine--D-glutamate ligase